MEKEDLKKAFKWFMWLKMPFTFYLFASLLIVPSIDAIDAEVVFGAHRGSSIEYKENTLEAFENALIDERYEFIEFDVTYTQDMEMVVIHQNNMIRLPKNGAVVRNLSYDELQELFEFHIPSYKEVMDLIAGEKPLDIEIKSTKDFEKDVELVEAIIQDAKRRGILDQIMISSISSEIVEYVEENYPEIQTGKIYWITPFSMIPIEAICDEVYETSADYVFLHGENLHNFQTLIECKPQDKELVFWYFTDEVYIIGEKRFWEDGN